jgi:hypothetical protein
MPRIFRRKFNCLFDAQPPDLPPLRLMDMGFAVSSLFARKL